ncbi:hypothetical protein [Caballeronia sp. LZ001]|uniref:hypothetical protein n=2 Tax=Caballeronia TaxID=1827195 RepID=UPI0038D432AA
MSVHPLSFSSRKSKPCTRQDAASVLAFVHSPTEKSMRFDYRSFHIDCTAPHDEDGNYQAHARITRASEDDTAHVEVFDSGDLDSFQSQADALHCARSWAIEWCDEVLA